MPVCVCRPVAGTSRLCSERGSCRRASAISLQLHGPSRPTSNQPTSHRAEWSRTERSRKQELARRCRDRVVQTERPGRQASALTSSGQVAMYRNSLVFLTWGIAAVGGMVVALEWYFGWCYFAGVVRQYGAVSRQVLISFFECVVQYRAQGTGGACFRSWSLKRC